MGGWKKQCLFVIVLSSFLLLAVNGAPENSQEATDHEEQGNNQNDNAYLAHELASQQNEEPMQQEDDLPIADDDNMPADQADEPDSDAQNEENEDNDLKQQDHDDDPSDQGVRKCHYVRRLVCRTLVCRNKSVRCWRTKRVCRTYTRKRWWKRRRYTRCYNHRYYSWCSKRRCSYIG